MTILKKIDPEPDICPVNIKLAAYNNSKIPILGKYSLTLKHKKDHFEILSIVVDSKYVPILGLATSESLNLIKRISAVNVSDQQFLSEFSDCFGEIPRNYIKSSPYRRFRSLAALLNFSSRFFAVKARWTLTFSIYAQIRRNFDALQC